MKNEIVILLHGILIPGIHLRPLETYLRGEGYEVINYSYPSRHHTLETLIPMVAEGLSPYFAQTDKTVHIVGYSMGGLITRGVIQQLNPQNLGRVILLATPNHGSEVADFFKNWWLFKQIFGPAGQQLTTDADLDGLLGTPEYPLGIIAGNATMDPISSYLILKKPNDGKVTVESTRLPHMTDHLTLPASHFFLPKNKTMHKQVKQFLETGHFLHS